MKATIRSHYTISRGDYVVYLECGGDSIVLARSKSKQTALSMGIRKLSSFKRILNGRFKQHLDANRPL